MDGVVIEARLDRRRRGVREGADDRASAELHRRGRPREGHPASATRRARTDSTPGSTCATPRTTAAVCCRAWDGDEYLAWLQEMQAAIATDADLTRPLD